MYYTVKCAVKICLVDRFQTCIIMMLYNSRLSAKGPGWLVKVHTGASCYKVESQPFNFLNWVTFSDFKSLKFQIRHNDSDQQPTWSHCVLANVCIGLCTIAVMLRPLSLPLPFPKVRSWACSRMAGNQHSTSFDIKIVCRSWIIEDSPKDPSQGRLGLTALSWTWSFPYRFGSAQQQDLDG